MIESKLPKITCTIKGVLETCNENFSQSNLLIPPYLNLCIKCSKLEWVWEVHIR
jgi:hypothetical protein